MKARDDQGVDRDARRAGHQRRHQDGGQPVALVVDHPRRHDARDGAGEGRQQRDEGAAVQAGAAHDPVHQEGRAGHVAEVLQQDDEEEQDQDLRQEDDHAADAGDHPVLEEAVQQVGQRRGLDQGAEPGEAVRISVHQRPRPGEHRLEHHEQHGEQDRPGRPPDAAARRRPCAVQRSGSPGARTAARRMRSASRWAPRISPASGARQSAALAGGRSASSRSTSASSSSMPPLRMATVVTIGSRARAPGPRGRSRCRWRGDVDHVERQHHRPADLLQLQRQAQHQAQVGGVGHADDQVGRRSPASLPSTASRVTSSSGLRARSE